MYRPSPSTKDMEIAPDIIINSQIDQTQPKSISSKIRIKSANSNDVLASSPTLPSTRPSAADGTASFVFHIVPNRQLLAKDMLEEEEGVGGVEVDVTSQLQQSQQKKQQH